MDDKAVSDLVRDWELESTIDNDNCTIHTFYVSDPANGWWRQPREEKWEPKMRLGRGSFGDVWLQKCTSGSSAGDVRAVKEIWTGFDHSSIQAKFLSREISAIIKFSHTQYRDCFVPFFGWYRNQDSIFITMEYLPLGDLQLYLHNPLPESQARAITQQVLQGLTFMHKSNFAHRDLKPKNILVQNKGPNWWVKISDFGCSKQNEFTDLHTVVGTTSYLAPELQNIFVHTDLDLITSKTYSLAVDIWAIGVIAFRITTGRLPFNLPTDLYRYVIMDDPFPTDKSLSAECKDFIALTMSGSPRRRPTALNALASPWIVSSTVLDASTLEASTLEASTLKTSTLEASPSNTKPFGTTPSGLQDDNEGSAAWSTIGLSSGVPMSNKPGASEYDSPDTIPVHSHDSKCVEAYDQSYDGDDCGDEYSDDNNKPSGGAYKVNVNSPKEKKWVQARVQNYDGDDWGDEYSDYDEEPSGGAYNVNVNSPKMRKWVEAKDQSYNEDDLGNEYPNDDNKPSGGAYKVNVNSPKTRKWVQAKVQNYDGDDWGDEYSDDDEEP